MSLDVMKQALEALEDAVSAWRAEMEFRSCIDAAEPWAKAAEVLRAAIEQAQEPVAWMYHGIRHDDTPHERPSLIWKPEYMDVMSAEKGAKATPLYAAEMVRLQQNISIVWSKEDVDDLIKEMQCPSVPEDARLIAAAPDLLEALEDMLGWQTLAPDDVVAAARASIAKARGEK